MVNNLVFGAKQAPLASKIVLLTYSQAAMGLINFMLKVVQLTK